MAYRIADYIFNAVLPCLVLGFSVGQIWWTIISAIYEKKQLERRLYALEYASRQERLFWHNMLFFRAADSTAYDGESKILFSRLSCIKRWLYKLHYYGYTPSPAYVATLLDLACYEVLPEDIRWLIPGTRDGEQDIIFDTPAIVKKEHTTIAMEGISLDLDRE